MNDYLLSDEFDVFIVDKYNNKEFLGTFQGEENLKVELNENQKNIILDCKDTKVNSKAEKLLESDSYGKYLKRVKNRQKLYNKLKKSGR